MDKDVCRIWQNQPKPRDAKVVNIVSQTMSSEIINDSFGPNTNPLQRDPEGEWMALNEWVLDHLPNVDPEDWMKQFEIMKARHQTQLDEYHAISAEYVRPSVKDDEQTPDHART